MHRISIKIFKFSNTQTPAHDISPLFFELEKKYTNKLPKRKKKDETMKNFLFFLHVFNCFFLKIRIIKIECDQLRKMVKPTIVVELLQFFLPHRHVQFHQFLPLIFYQEFQAEKNDVKPPVLEVENDRYPSFAFPEQTT